MAKDTPIADKLEIAVTIAKEATKVAEQGKDVPDTLLKIVENALDIPAEYLKTYRDNYANRNR
jgi:hypothetical protein